MILSVFEESTFRDDSANHETHILNFITRKQSAGVCEKQGGGGVGGRRRVVLKTAVCKKTNLSLVCHEKSHERTHSCVANERTALGVISR